MRTNLEKWNFYFNEITLKSNDFIKSILPIIPEVFYKVENNGEVYECTVLNAHYSHRMHYWGKRPTNDDVQMIKGFYEDDEPFDAKNAYIDYRYCWNEENGYTSTTAINIIDLVEGKNAFLDKETAEKVGKEKKKAFDDMIAFKEKHKKDANYSYGSNGYKFLGWQNGWKHVYFDEDGNVTTGDESKGEKPRKSFGYLEADYPEYGKCIREKHRRIEVQHSRSGSENTVSCPLCMIYWKYDSSD